MKKSSVLLAQWNPVGNKGVLSVLVLDDDEAVVDFLRELLEGGEGQTVTTHGRVNKIVLALTHEAANQIKTMIANVCAGIEQIRGTAPQFEGA